MEVWSCFGLLMITARLGLYAFVPEDFGERFVLTHFQAMRWLVWPAWSLDTHLTVSVINQSSLLSSVQILSLFTYIVSVSYFVWCDPFNYMYWYFYVAYTNVASVFTYIYICMCVYVMDVYFFMYINKMFVHTCRGLCNSWYCKWQWSSIHTSKCGV